MKLLQFLSIMVFLQAQAQGQYEINNTIPVYVGDVLLTNPSAGGFNTPQFSEIDINLDGYTDLFVFERSAEKVLLFERVGENYIFTTAYDNIFPHFSGWAILRDYNCDGLLDIFTYYSGSTAIYKAEITDETLGFTLAADQLTYYDDFPISIYTSRSDIPDFTDINNDGDIDVISFGVSGTTIRYFENLSQENFWGCDSLLFDLASYCWGDINEGATCSGADLGVVCKGNADNVLQSDQLLHVGSTILTLDKDADGDEDLVLGDVTCDNLVYYENGGDLTYSTMISKDTLFPSESIPVKFPEFLSSFLVDVDADMKKDLLVSTNDYNFGLNKQNVWLYKNTATDATYSFSFVQNDFLTESMIDVGKNAKPVFTDYNADGLIDIVIGTGECFGEEGNKTYGLHLFENTGDAASPVFTFITDDYAGLASLAMPELYPAFADIDADADIDMFVGRNDGTILFLENIAGAGNPAEYAEPVSNYQLIDAGINAAPFLYDVDADGLIDMIVGEQNGNLNFYKNTGTVTTPALLLENELFGGVDVREPGSPYGYSTPFFYRNENDTLFLLTGSESGKIYKYDEIEESLAGEFHERDTLFLGTVSGYYSSISGADINADGTFEFITGNNRGGVQFFQFDEAVPAVDVPADVKVSVYPNPAADVLYFRHPVALQFTEVIIKNMLGQQMPIKYEGENQLDIKNLSTGLYILEVMFEGKQPASTVFIKQ